VKRSIEIDLGSVLDERRSLRENQNFRYRLDFDAVIWK
jgi:hypothetical protein